MRRTCLGALALAACHPGPRDSQAPDDTAPPCDFTTVDIYQMYEHVVDGTTTDCEISLFESILDQRELGAGPWYEDLWVVPVMDSSTVDVTGATHLKVHAAVPEAYLGPDGRYYVYYVEGDLDVAREVARSRSNWFATHGIVGYGALRLMVSDDGYTFTEEEEFGIEGLVRGLVVDPDLVAFRDGTYRLYYVGTPIPDLLPDGSWDEDAPHIVYMAESTDLIHWKQQGVAVEGPNADPSVLCLNDMDCMMASTGVELSVSSDGGRTFSLEGDWQAWGFAPEFTKMVGPGYRMFYNSKVKGGALQSLFSVDGTVWAREEGERCPAYTVEAVSLVPAPTEGWLLYYHYWQDGYSGDSWAPGGGD